jgi:histone H3/H4
MGIFVGFSFSRDAEKEIRRMAREENLEIEMVTVDELVKSQLDKQIG